MIEIGDHVQFDANSWEWDKSKPIDSKMNVLNSIFIL